MRLPLVATIVVVGMISIAAPARAADQTQPGAGNARAASLASASPLLASGRRWIETSTLAIHNATLRQQTWNALFDPNTCVTHRTGLGDADKDAIVQQLTAQGFINGGEASGFPGGARAGV